MSSTLVVMHGRWPWDTDTWRPEWSKSHTALYANTQIFCDGFRLGNLKCLGLIGTHPLTIVSSLTHCMTTVFFSAYMRGFHPHCVILHFRFLSHGFWGQGFFNRQCSIFCFQDFSDGNLSNFYLTAQS